jgi:hypothetical protein
VEHERKDCLTKITLPSLRLLRLRALYRKGREEDRFCNLVLFQFWEQNVPPAHIYPPTIRETLIQKIVLPMKPNKWRSRL